MAKALEPDLNKTGLLGHTTLTPRYHPRTHCEWHDEPEKRLAQRKSGWRREHFVLQTIAELESQASLSKADAKQLGYIRSWVSGREKDRRKVASDRERRAPFQTRNSAQLCAEVDALVAQGFFKPTDPDSWDAKEALKGMTL